MFRDAGTKSLSEGLLEEWLYRTYASDVTKIWSALSWKAFKLRQVDNFLASPMRRYWDSRPDCPSIKLSESAASEPLPGEIVPKGTEYLVSLIFFKLLLFGSGLQWGAGLMLHFTQPSLLIAGHWSFCWEHWTSSFVDHASRIIREGKVEIMRVCGNHASVWWVIWLRQPINGMTTAWRMRLNIGAG